MNASRVGRVRGMSAQPQAYDRTEAGAVLTAVSRAWPRLLLLIIRSLWRGRATSA
jgi:hypothetical protein